MPQHNAGDLPVGNSHFAPDGGDGCCLLWSGKGIGKYSNQILEEECHPGLIVMYLSSDVY